ncbi:hypothetical protein SAY87_000645 [Trapa incisa]|uniref:PB1 domain-containing protein n=1 Tax=Trapa incisa TaxID=236973 RepID=A0AAN7JGC7_9MYRT|nr:hypothetical protein SAY87_000645 [Trapa incisa]
MESNSFSYTDSGNSSPGSREIDGENSFWDEQQQQQPPPPVPLPHSNNSSYRVRFMCSYGGKIQPRPHDNHLAYVGGETKILGVDRSIKFSALMSKLSAICDLTEISLKYQLPGEDLDALISVTNDEDLDHLMVEYDRLHKTAAKPARLRLFLFPLTTQSSSTFRNGESKSEGHRQQWFVDALNSVQLQSLEGSSVHTAVPSPQPPPVNPDFLFGLDKGLPQMQAAPAAPEVRANDASAGSDCGSEDPYTAGDPMLSPAEIQRQIEELQRMQISNPALQRRVEEGNPRAIGDSYGMPTVEKVAPAAQAPVSVPAPVQLPAGYLPERHLTSGSYAVTGTGTEQAVYYIPAPAGSYLAPPTYRPAAGPIGPAYYGVQRLVQDAYREQSVYGAMPQPATIQQPLKGGAHATEGIQMVQSKLTMVEPGLTQMAYDSSGRQVYYTAAGGGMMPAYQAAAAMAVDGWQGAGPLNQEPGKAAAAKAP